MILENEKILLTVKEFAKVSGLGETCIRNLAHVEGFPALRNGRKVLIHRRAAAGAQKPSAIGSLAQAGGGPAASKTSWSIPCRK